MAAMSTVLKLQSRMGHNSTYTVPAVHSALKPKLVLQKRRVPTGAQTMLDDTITVLDSTEDANGLTLSSKIGISVNIRRPVNGISADLTAAWARFLDIVNGDEALATVTNQDNLS